jgi:actin-related protein 3
MNMPAVVMDNGSRYSKMGYSGNLEPDIVIPTVVADLDNKNTLRASTKSYEYNYYIGDEAINKTKESNTHKLIYPVKNGIVENWDLMEKFWHKCIYNYLKCDPQMHYFALTESSMNTPKNRENMGEIFFETFNVPGLYIGNQATFALLGSRKIYLKDNAFRKDEEQEKAFKSLTGIVVDSRNDITHIIPLCDGFVVSSNINYIPIGGKPITKFIEQLIKERGQINFVDLYYATMELNEKYGYLPLDEAIDLTIQKCPVDYRRRLYSNIVILDATSIQNLDRRIELCLQKRIDQRLRKCNSRRPESIKVNVTNFIESENVVWIGGSELSNNEDFRYVVHFRDEYFEKGPSCFRFNYAFSF